MANAATGAKGPSIEFTAVPGDKIERLAFHAAAITCGFKAPENGPQVANSYTEEMPWRPRDPYPGRVSFLLEVVSSTNRRLDALRQIWTSEEARKDILEACNLLPSRIAHARSAAEIESVATDAEAFCEMAMVVFMWHRSRGRITDPSPGPATDEESQAIAAIDTLPAMIRASKTQAQRQNLARKMGQVWKPCIAGWLKAWRHNFREQAHKWQEGRKTILIDRRESGLLPLLIPICKDPAKTQRMIDRWT